MPNRIIKESICTSDTIDLLSWFEECFFYRLIVNCDDYGRMDARPPILRANLFPLKTVTDKQVETALQSLRTAAMIDLYVVNGRSYLQLRTWGNHQTVRNQRSKYPAPKDIDFIPEKPYPSEADIETFIYNHFEKSGCAFGDKLISINRQVRAGESYLDIVAKCQNNDFVIELKRNRLSNKSIEQIIKYLSIVDGAGVLIGCGLSANFDIDKCRSEDIAIITYDDSLKFDLILESSSVKTCEITLQTSEITLASNPIQSLSVS